MEMVILKTDNKNNYGFTLIELLAVIVILSIIMVIATISVSSKITSSKKSSFEATAHNIKKALDLKVTTNEEEFADLPKTIDVQELDIDNKEKLSGTVTVIKQNGRIIYDLNITDGSYIIQGTEEKALKKEEIPILKLKNNVGFIDNARNLIYSIDKSSFISDLSPYFTVENGTVEYIKNDWKFFSTDSAIVLKDSTGKVYKEYKLVIYGDINGDGAVDIFDAAILNQNLNKPTENSTSAKLVASDLNRDGIVNNQDYELLMQASVCNYNQITGKCE